MVNQNSRFPSHCKKIKKITLLLFSRSSLIYMDYQNFTPRTPLGSSENHSSTTKNSNLNTFVSKISISSSISIKLQVSLNVSTEIVKEKKRNPIQRTKLIYSHTLSSVQLPTLPSLPHSKKPKKTLNPTRITTTTHQIPTKNHQKSAAFTVTSVKHQHNQTLS